MVSIAARGLVAQDIEAFHDKVLVSRLEIHPNAHGDHPRLRRALEPLVPLLALGREPTILLAGAKDVQMIRVVVEEEPADSGEREAGGRAHDLAWPSEATPLGRNKRCG